VVTVRGRTLFLFFTGKKKVVRAAGIEPAQPRPRDFKSLASTSFATPAYVSFQILKLFRQGRVLQNISLVLQNFVRLSFFLRHTLAVESLCNFCLILDVSSVMSAHPLGLIPQRSRDLSRPALISRSPSAAARFSNHSLSIGSFIRKFPS
jgi:hypothetical protein